jgi:hypothetical protein
MWRLLAGGAAMAGLVALGAPSVAVGHDVRASFGGPDPQGSGPGAHRLLAVVDVSATDVWAAGFYYPKGRSHLQLLKHYDGDVWNVRTGPAQTEGSELRDFQSFGGSDVWVVGKNFQASFIGHWDGDRWQQVANPHPSDFEGLSGLGGASPDDVWAVGSASLPDFTTVTVADHWDGSTWTRVPTPNATQSNGLAAVYAISSDDVWAVGGGTGPLIEHWDGAAWSLVDQPAPAGTLTSVIGFAPDDVWAVGHVGRYPLQTAPLLEHWDGVAWSVVENLHMGALGSLYALSGTSASDIWAVGCTLHDVRFGHLTVIEHYDGTRWTRVKSPNPQPYATQCLFGVSASSPTEAWAVGTYGYNDENFGPTRNLLAHWDGTTWTWDRSPRH